MKQTLVLTALLIAGLAFSQLLPKFFGAMPEWFSFGRNFLMMGLLAYIMIEVGKEFELDMNNKRDYAVDYAVAATAAAFPWIFVSLYFLFVLMPAQTTIEPPWLEALMVGRFAAPTSAGVLFTMLSASGLAGTWVFKKTRTLAIFDDLDTVLLMIPIQMLIVGLAWQLGAVVIVLGLLLYLGIKFYRKMDFPQNWTWTLFYAFLIVVLRDLLHEFTLNPRTSVGMEIEVLLPAFILGCVLKKSEEEQKRDATVLASRIVSGLFMLLVGLSMPVAFGPHAQFESKLEPMGYVFHVLMITLLSNIGKIVPCFCYRKEARFKERLAVVFAMFPRGEVGAGILGLSLSYGANGPHIAVAFMSLALNLILTVVFIMIVKKLLEDQLTRNVLDFNADLDTLSTNRRGPNMKASEFMTKDVISLTTENTVEEAAKLMLEKNISVVPITDRESHLVGIITESDFIGKDAHIPHALASIKRLLGQIFYSSGVEDIFLKSKTLPLEKVMTRTPKTVDPDFTLDDVINMMIHFKLKRIPVIQNGKLVGMITRHDILRAFALLKN